MDEAGIADIGGTGDHGARLARHLHWQKRLAVSRAKQLQSRGGCEEEEEEGGWWGAEVSRALFGV